MAAWRPLRTLTVSEDGREKDHGWACQVVRMYSGRRILGNFAGSGGESNPREGVVMNISDQISPKALRIVKSVTAYHDDGRDVEQQLEERDKQIRKEGMWTTGSQWRRYMISGLGLRPREWGAPTGDPSENLIMTGCHPVLGLDEPTAFFRLVQQLGGKYTFLDKEYCCGLSGTMLPLIKGDKVAQSRGLARAEEYIGMNIDEARRLGVRRMYCICLYCVYLARRFYMDCDVEQLYYLDLLLDLIEAVKPSLKLEAKVAYYEGCHERKYVHLGGDHWDCNWEGYRACLERVEGLSIVAEVPKGMCCMLDPDGLIDRAGKNEGTTVVTPCWSCYTNLRVLGTLESPFNGLSQILLKAFS